MSVIDLHPDELIERSQRGMLTAEERARLNEHLAKCVACRFECAVSRDFDDESARVDGLAARVADALREAASNDASVASASPPAGLHAHMPRWAWVAAALLLFVSSGIATAQTGLLESVASYVIPRVESVFGKRETERKAPRVRRAGSPVQAVVPAPQPPAPPVPAEEVAQLAPFAAPEAPKTLTRVTSAAPGRRSAPVHAPRAPRSVPTVARPASLTVPGGIAAPYVPPAGQAAPVTAAPNPVAAPAPAPVVAPALAPDPRVQAAGMFADANELRHDGRAREAAARYRELQSHHAGSPEARLSLVLLGRLELDRGEAKAALESFDAYVATGERALREQALAGRALALGKLGREAATCAAFDELLRSYPHSAYASVAQARCERD